MKKILYLLFLILLVSCGQEHQSKELQIHQGQPTDSIPTPVLTLEQGNKLAALPLHCLETEYPNKMGHVTASPTDQKRPSEQHPVFYGCFDWHSAVHGYWSAVSLLKSFPELESRAALRSIIDKHLTPENIEVEIAYFHTKQNTTFERTYGWAWLLKLQQELDTWDDPQAHQWSGNLQPLTDLIIQRYSEYLPKLQYAIRVGEHSNTAFGMVFAWDYAQHKQLNDFQAVLKQKALEFYREDQDCPISWEPSGYDFLSPCLEEVDLMRRLLPESEFHNWLVKFLPGIQDGRLDIEIGKIADRTDGKLVHLDGLNLSRAWVLYGLAAQYPKYSSLMDQADLHLSHTLPNLVADDYAGGHWLGSFAIYALQNAKNAQENI
ncbi:DUF2891 domain-containing protein [Nonlabens xiamenensis]|uniref:DUF2891 domain-containing protein n=1 Tax=Nonlabens xiamenensis TaxID=2341043 RepID=UPI000F613D68|nr:DUF2891 domain-containing protein [Nonlabens xiamenensis]